MLSIRPELLNILVIQTDGQILGKNKKKIAQKKCPGSFRLVRQLKTAADCQDNSRQLQIIADMNVLACSVKC